jgi:hypothetical protein
MISHIHDDRTPGEEQAPSPVEDKQTATTPEGRSGPTSALPRRWIDVPMSLLGVTLPMVAGALVSWSWMGGELFDAAWVFCTVVLGVVLSMVIGACLLRSKWALVLAPVAWAVGEILGAVLIPLIQGGWPALQAENQFWEAQGTILSLAFSPLVLCAALGAGAGSGRPCKDIMSCRCTTAAAMSPATREADIQACGSE